MSLFSSPSPTLKPATEGVAGVAFPCYFISFLSFLHQTDLLVSSLLKFSCLFSLILIGILNLPQNFLYFFFMSFSLFSYFLFFTFISFFIIFSFIFHLSFLIVSHFNSGFLFNHVSIFLSLSLFYQFPIFLNSFFTYRIFHYFISFPFLPRQYYHFFHIPPFSQSYSFHSIRKHLHFNFHRISESQMLKTCHRGRCCSAF